ncbi:uncharacterized protein CMC5_000230 [Chondromyces crocatus]|uniref:Uncharacterized protein n=2 Tax=Chondromyces crocatus TaxID=52 RepID=A0A0K1E5E0_CHOCO|nr:uncharacterized protein CMC5_000230 [Chondromyces crocatus]
MREGSGPVEGSRSRWRSTGSTGSRSLLGALASGLRCHGAAVAVTMALTLPGLGCNVLSKLGPGNCDRSIDANPAIGYSEGSVEAGVYMSATWDLDAPKRDQELLFFPGGMRYEIQHKLGEMPRWWLAYLSFDRYGADTESIAIAAGNQVEVKDVNDRTITLVNASCSDYWLLLVVGGVDADPPEGLPD